MSQDHPSQAELCGRIRWEEYARISFQYHAAATWSAAHGHTPVAGNLMHHAFEMLLKAALLKAGAVPKGDEPDRWFSRRFRHRLSALWIAVSKVFDLRSLEPHRRHLDELDAWEEVRYPTLRRANIGMYVAYTPLPDRLNVSPNVNVYRLEVAALDAVFRELIRLFSINADAFSETKDALSPNGFNTYSDETGTVHHL